MNPYSRPWPVLLFVPVLTVMCRECRLCADGLEVCFVSGCSQGCVSNEVTRLCRDSPVTCLLCSVEILCQSGMVEPGAMKRLKYGTPWEQLKANCELAALKDAEGCSHLVQILAVFDYWCPTDQQRYLYIATK